MTIALKKLRRSDPYLYAIAAIVCAAALVLYLQRRAVVELRGQTAVVLRQIAEQTAREVAIDVRRTLEGPVFDTLTAVNHPQIREGRLDLLAAEYKAGLAAFPQVERFFVWTEGTDALVPGEVLFLGAGHRPTTPMPRGVPAAFDRDPALGRAVLALARRYAPSQQIYAAYEQVGGERDHSAFLRLFWTDARRDRFFAVIGFIVDRQRVHDALIPELHRRRLGRILKVRGGELPFDLRVIDEQGATVWGAPAPQPLAARVPLSMMFYPADTLGPRLVQGIAPLTWTIEVSPAHADQMLDVAAHGYWLPSLSLLLMVIALTFTVKARRHADATATMQADFVAHVSHQLKTPLSLLSAATETVELDRVKSPEKLAQYLEIIRTEVGRLTALVQRILEFSTVQQQRPLEFDAVDLSALVRETVEQFQTSLVGQHFTFRVVQNGPTPWLDADPAALEQVLANLLDNAVKYSGTQRTVTVVIGWSGAKAIVDVVDSGIGVVTVDRRRIFDKFYRGSGEAHHRQGFGLGLPIARQLVEAHGGRLDLHSSGPGGTVFRITLPATARAIQPPHPAAIEALR
jgi:signal transduction histidine kinase